MYRISFIDRNYKTVYYIGIGIESRAGGKTSSS
jgi:hypothetical protein